MNKKLLPVLLSSLLTGCWLMGDHFPQYEIGQVSKTDTGFCFQINSAKDYYAHYLSIRDRSSPEYSGFNRKLPALNIVNDELCIPKSYYSFPDSGEVSVNIALRSPTEIRMIRRNIVSEFYIIQGVPHPFTSGEYSVRTVDYVQELEQQADHNGD